MTFFILMINIATTEATALLELALQPSLDKPVNLLTPILLIMRVKLVSSPHLPHLQVRSSKLPASALIHLDPQMLFYQLCAT